MSEEVVEPMLRASSSSLRGLAENAGQLNKGMSHASPPSTSHLPGLGGLL